MLSSCRSRTIFERWSYSVPLFCYMVFLCVMVFLPVPLRSSITIKIDDMDVTLKRSLEETFIVKMRNSNFKTDGGERYRDESLSDKNEYLVNVNNNENFNKEQNDILMDVFKKADVDRSGKLDPKELANWIRKKIVEHISFAVGNNFNLFMEIDVDPPNGVVTWKEYHAYFLKKRGFSKKYVQHHNEKIHKGMSRATKEQMMKDKASWLEAAKSDANSLTVDEFLAFTHPESSATNQLALVDELYDKFDRDGDELLTEDEFAILQTEGNNDEMVVIRQDENQRRAEFRTSIDLNGDGKADRRELLHYVAPQSPRHSEHEAEALLALADTDQDHMLSIDEILAHPNLFLKSKMVDTARSFHDEF
ncbi:45 kDa calcium-binding protein [Onthophagus taurus]|uniref:45 kDa calcium-binding protein n=1 Tax=Onthophagus taurus TaxID=166361 RepID=UPI000C209A9D|nr:45 kDa calcium-binding protein [Onthophagus taurus]